MKICQIQLQKILEPDSLPDYLSVSYDYGVMKSYKEFMESI